jgi:predicted permease
MSSLAADFRFALRLLLKSPGFTAVAVFTLALALGVNSAIFSLIHGLLLRPLAPLRPSEVVNVYSARRDATRDYRQFSHAEYLAVGESREVFSHVGAIGLGLAGLGREQGDVRRSFVCIVSDTFFPVMGVQPAAGRFFTAEESQPNADLPVAVLTYPFWERLGGGNDIVGSTIRVNGQPFTVVGITPQGFSGISLALAPQVFLPLGVYGRLPGAFNDSNLRDLRDPKLHAFNLTARLKPGLSFESARAALPLLSNRLTKLQPADSPSLREVQLTPPGKFSISTAPSDDGPIGLIAGLLFAMAGIVLLIACLNLANMFLARGTGRAREIAVRLAVGATRWQIVRQLLVEGFLVSLGGGALGLLLSYWTNSLLAASFAGRLSTFNFALTAKLTPDANALAATFIFCLLATVLSSLGPALRISRADVNRELKLQAGDPATAGRWNRLFAGRHLLVMAQMALSLVLLFSGGLFFRGALHAGALLPGFDPRGAVLAEIDYSLINTPNPEAARRQAIVLDRVRALPGVRAAGLSTLIPYSSITNTARLMPAGEALPANTDPSAPRPGTSGIFTAATRGYLAALGVRLLQGRDFTDLESTQKNSPPVCIVDEGLAHDLFPKDNALGQRVRFTQAPTAESPAEMEIVGIVSRHRHEVTDPPPARRRIYVPLAQNFSAAGYLMIRLHSAASGAVAQFLPTLRAELRRTDPDLPVLNLSPFVAEMDKTITLWVIRLAAVLFGTFGSIALLLAVVGVYGVKAYAVERRTREIGIRLALGADRRAIFSLIMTQGAQQTAAAVAVGLVLSLLVGQALSRVLFNVKPWDPLVLLGATLLLAAAALLACWLPARRATAVSPAVALRLE